MTEFYGFGMYLWGDQTPPLPKEEPLTQKKVTIDFKAAEPATKQQFRDGTKIDSVLRKYETLGVSDLGLHLHQRTAQEAFGIADTTYDYQTHLNRILAIQRYFLRLPSAIRDRFGNNPATMIKWLADPSNLEEAKKLGLFRSEGPPPAATDPRPPAPPPPPSGGAAPKG